MLPSWIWTLDPAYRTILLGRYSTRYYLWWVYRIIADNFARRLSRNIYLDGNTDSYVSRNWHWLLLRTRTTNVAPSSHNNGDTNKTPIMYKTYNIKSKTIDEVSDESIEKCYKLIWPGIIYLTRGKKFVTVKESAKYDFTATEHRQRLTTWLL